MVSQSKYDPAAPSRAGSLDLIGGALALDFANTSSGRGTERCLEHLKAPEHVAIWAEHAGIVDEATRDRALTLIDAGAAAFDGLLIDALALREAVHRAASAVARGETPTPSDLVILKEACAKAIAAADLAPTDARLAWTWPTDPPAKETLLGPIALSAVGLFRESDPARIKQCGGEHCGWVFFDLTKNKSRRWCEMSVCGNRAKARRFRATNVQNPSRPRHVSRRKALQPLCREFRMTDAVPQQPFPIVLVHGAFEDASIWSDVAALLRGHGFNVVAVDLPGRPANPLPTPQASLDLYRDTVLAAIDKVGPPVVLVGHSFGGITVSAVAEAAPEKVKKVVYLAAYLPQDGDSLQSLALTDADSKMGPNFVVDTTALTASVKPEARAELFGNDANEAQKQAILAAFFDEPLIPPGTPVHVSAERFGKVAKAYIHTARDVVVSPSLQHRMARAAGVTETATIDSGHAPFFTQPDKLAEAIARLAV